MCSQVLILTGGSRSLASARTRGGFVTPARETSCPSLQVASQVIFPGRVVEAAEQMGDQCRKFVNIHTYEMQTDGVANYLSTARKGRCDGFRRRGLQRGLGGADEVHG